MKKRMFIMLLAWAFALSACGSDVEKKEAVSGAAETEMLVTTPAETRLPEKIDAKETAKPGTTPTAAPAETKTPEETPKEAEVSRKTEAPKITEASRATEKPKTTTAPATAKPVTTRQPETQTGTNASTGILATEAPQAGGSQSGTDNTEKTEISKSTEPPKTPEPTKQPLPIPAPTAEPTPEPCSHNFVKEYLHGEPTCRRGGYYNLICSICGTNGGDGSDPALAHSPVDREEVHAQYCNEHGVILTECSVCGFEMGRQGYDGADHDWTTEEVQEPFWNEESHQVEYETKEVTYCTRCSVHQ